MSGGEEHGARVHVVEDGSHRPAVSGAAWRPRDTSLTKDTSKMCGLQKTERWPVRAQELVLLGVCLFVCVICQLETWGITEWNPFLDALNLK